MAANAGAVFAGLGQDLVTGTVLSGVFGTPLPPTDNTFFDSTLNVGFKDSGYVGERGISIQQGRSFTDILDMDGNAVDSIQTESNGTIQGNFLELSEQPLKNVFGDDNVTVTASTLSAGTRIAIAAALGEDLDPKSHVLRMKSGKKRAGLVVPKARFTDIGEIGFTRSGAASIDWTMKCIPVYDAVRAKNVDFYLFLDDGVFAVSLVPVIQGISPSGKGAGEPVLITGLRFTGTVPTSGVKFGGTNAADFEVINDQQIVAILPAGSAGPTNVLVTNASGASATYSYTRIV